MFLSSCALSPAEQVNYEVNKYQYVSDHADEWKTPRDFYSHGGDCEDFAIAKMHRLVSLGVSSKQLFLMYVRTPHLAHMVLADFSDNPLDPKIFDNRRPDIYRLSETDYEPVYIINDTGFFMYSGGSRHKTPLPARLALKWNSINSF